MDGNRIYYSHDAEVYAMRNKAILRLAFLTFGLGMGAALAVLFSPISGKKARAELAETVGDGLNVGRESIETFKKRLEDQFAELRNNVEGQLKQI